MLRSFLHSCCGADFCAPFVAHASGMADVVRITQAVITAVTSTTVPLRQNWHCRRIGRSQVIAPHRARAGEGTGSPPTYFC